MTQLILSLLVKGTAPQTKARAAQKQTQIFHRLSVTILAHVVSKALAYEKFVIF